MKMPNLKKILNIFSENFVDQEIVETPGQVVYNSKWVENIPEPLTFLLLLHEVNKNAESVVWEGRQQKEEKWAVDVDGVLDGVGYGVRELDCALESLTSLLSCFPPAPGHEDS